MLNISMKKVFLFFAAFAFAGFVSCANVSEEQAASEYEAKVSELLQSANEENEDEVIEELVSESLEVIKNYPDGELAVSALQNIYYLVEADVLEEAINLLGEEQKQSEFVQNLATGLEAKKNTAEGNKFTDFEVDGVKFSDFVGKGKYMLVDFWASWCGPCKGEIPNMKAVYEKYAGEDFDILSVAVWDEPQASKDTAFVYGIKWNHMVNTQKVATDIYGIDGIPHIILIGPDGTIIKRNLRGAEIEQEVSKYVNAK